MERVNYSKKADFFFFLGSSIDYIDYLGHFD